MLDLDELLLNAFLVLLASTYAIFHLDSRLDRFYVFEPDSLHAVSQQALQQHGNDTAAVVASIVSSLRADPAVAPYLAVEEEWVTSNAGGATGAIRLIHYAVGWQTPGAASAKLICAGITEYLIIFGTAIGTEGRMGRTTADDYFHILSGEQLAYIPGTYMPEVYGPGAVHHLPRGQGKQYAMTTSCFALEYARGWVPPIMLAGTMDTLRSRLDFGTLWRTAVVTGREMGGNLLLGKV